jgi:hypothetical protein
MNFAEVKTKSSSWKTSINGTFEEVAHYFMGKRFNVASYPIEQMEEVIEVNLFDETGEILGSTKA